MNILHVLNTAGAASVIAKYMDELYDTKSRVLTRESQDPYGLTTYGKALPIGFWIFIALMILEARKYDIIHIHDRDILIPVLKFLNPEKPIIIHYHGTKIRRKWEQRKRFWIKADRILISTRDLFEGAPPGVELAPNPVDLALFFPVNNRIPIDKAIHFKYNADDIAKQLAKMHGIDLVIHDTSTDPIPHREMRSYLTQYTTFIDVKRDVRGNILYPENTLSKTALEALACGLKVIPCQGDIIEKLPEEHHPRNVVTQMYRIYKELLQVE